jgi:hypothetical protein
VSETTDTQSPQTASDPTAETVPDAAQAKSIETLVAEWKSELDGQQSVSASNVQDRLLDLWGQHAVADIDARLQRVLATA